MENLLNSGTTTQKGKLQGGEKYFGYFVGIALIFAFGYILYHYGEMIIHTIKNGVILALWVGGTLAVVITLWKLRNIISYWWSILIKLAWKSMIEADPISAMRYAYNKWVREAETLNDTVIELESKEAELKRTLAENEQEANTYFSAGKKAKEMAGKLQGEEATDLTEEATANSIKAQRRAQSIKILIPRLETIQRALDYCKKLHKNWVRGLDLLNDDIKVKEADLANLKSVANAFRTAKSIIDGNSNDRVMYEEAVLQYGKKVSAYVGECKRFTEQAKNWAVNQDIQTAIETDEGLRLLEMSDDKFKELTNFSALLQDTPTREKVSMAQSSNEFVKSLEKPTVNKDFDYLK
jgi:hypothetical protein